MEMMSTPPAQPTKSAAIPPVRRTNRAVFPLPSASRKLNIAGFSPGPNEVVFAPVVYVRHGPLDKMQRSLSPETRNRCPGTFQSGDQDCDCSGSEAMRHYLSLQPRKQAACSPPNPKSFPQIEGQPVALPSPFL